MESISSARLLYRSLLMPNSSKIRENKHTKLVKGNFVHLFNSQNLSKIVHSNCFRFYFMRLLLFQRETNQWLILAENTLLDRLFLFALVVIAVEAPKHFFLFCVRPKRKFLSCYLILHLAALTSICAGFIYIYFCIHHFFFIDISICRVWFRWFVLANKLRCYFNNRVIIQKKNVCSRWKKKLDAFVDAGKYIEKNRTTKFGETMHELQRIQYWIGGNFTRTKR